MIMSRNAQAVDSSPNTGTSNVIVGTFRRIRRGHAVRYRGSSGPKPSLAAEKTPPEPRPARVAIMLALAHKLTRMLDEGKVASQADVARMLGMTPARVTQILDLTLLAPAVQERVLATDAGDEGDLPCEREMRAVLRAETWAAQGAVWERVLVANRGRC